MNKPLDTAEDRAGQIIEFEELKRAHKAGRMADADAPDPRETLDEIRRLGTDLRKALRDLPDALDTVTHQTLAPPLQSLTLMLSGLEGRLQGLEGAVIQQDTRQKDVLQANVSALALRLDGLQKRIDHLERNLHGLLDSLVRQNDTETQMFVEALNGRFNGVITILERVDYRLHRMERRMEEMAPSSPPSPPPAPSAPYPSPTDLIAAVAPYLPPDALPDAFPSVAPAPVPGEPEAMDDRRKPWFERRQEAIAAGEDVSLADQETVLDNSYRDLFRSYLHSLPGEEGVDVMPVPTEQKRPKH